jgi:hypothetical protein
VYLFDGKDCEEDKALILEAFIRFGLRKLIGGGFRFAPKISFEFTPELIARLSGYHRLVLHHCSKMAGAHSTQFEERYKHA